MANLSDIGAAATINLTSAIIFLVAFAMLRLQPFNDRVYFPKWYLKGTRSSPTHSGSFVSKFVNFDGRTYLRFLSWMPAALRMPEPELIEHAGLDSAVYVRIYLLGLKIFVPITILAFGVLVPVNWTSNSLESTKGLEFSDIDKLSISNVASGSQRFWAHVGMAYVFTFWTFYVLYMEYKRVAHMRHHFLASARRRADQFTVLVRCVPPDPDESVSQHVEHFFCVNHPEHYLTHQVVYNANSLATLVATKKGLRNWLSYYQNKYERSSPNKKPTTKTGFWGLWGKTVDAIEYYTAEIEKLSKEGPFRLVAEEGKAKSSGSGLSDSSNGLVREVLGSVFSYLVRTNSLPKFGTSERQWVEAQVENAKQQAILAALKSQVETHIHLDLHSLRRKHSDLGGELSNLYRKVDKLLSETIPDLCWELAELQDTYILQGDYDLKVMRQEYYIGQQKAVCSLYLQRQTFITIEPGVEVEVTIADP